VFKLVNKGKIPHDFKIAGKTSKMIAPGKTGSLTVVFKKKGSYAYVCTIFGHAKLGMKGTLAIATAAVTPPPTTTPTTTAPAAVCTNPVATTVTVSEFEFGFTLSETTVPCGTVTFVMTNNGTVTHNFVLSGAVPATSGVGPTINPKQTVSMATTVVPGSFDYLCSIPGHAESGMKGTLTVTG
jgi:nitrite reductase (NO-forming)